MPEQTEKEPTGPRATDEVIYLVATSSNANYGDEIVTSAWLRHLAEVRPEAEVWLDCPQPGVAAHLFANMHPNLRITDILWRVLWEADGREPQEAAEHVDHRIRNGGSPRYDIGIMGARRATTIHLLGGAHITALWPHHQLLPRVARRLKEISGARLVGTGLALTPMGSPVSLLEDLESFDHVTVRDQPSAEQTGAQLGSDDSFLGLDRLEAFSSRALSKIEDEEIWVCLQSDVADDGALEAAIEATRAFLTHPEQQGRTVRYLEMIPGVDRIAYDRLSDLIPEANLLSFLQVWDQGFPARPGQTWVTTRYHVHLLAAAAGAAGMAIEINDDYYRTKHTSLLEAGTGWSLVEVGSKLPKDPGIDPEFRVTAGRLHRTKQLEAAQIYPRATPKAAPVETATTSSIWKRSRRGQ